MTNKRIELSYNEDNISKDYLDKLDKLIFEKIKKIGKIKRFIT